LRFIAAVPLPNWTNDAVSVAVVSLPPKVPRFSVAVSFADAARVRPLKVVFSWV
jgi:hypothetical protein